jgi:CspA family cold shock protein
VLDHTPPLTGRVKWFDAEKGFGFVDLYGHDLFFHISGWIEARFLPTEGDNVAFDVVESSRRPGQYEARRVRYAESEALT